MNYPIVLHKDKDSDYGVTVPDLPGCFSALDEAVAMAKEAIELHLEGLAEEGQAIPQPNRIDDHQSHRDYRGGIWAVVTIDENTLRGKSVRLNVTMPERVVDAVDRYAAEHGETRSGLLVRAVSAFIGREGEPAKTPRRRLRKAAREKS